MAKDHMVAPVINQSKEYLKGWVQGTFLEHAVDHLSDLGKQAAESQVDKLHDHANNKINDLEKPYRKKIVAATVDTVAQGVVSSAVGTAVSYCAYKLTEMTITPILGSVASETVTSYAPWVSTAVFIASISVWFHSLQPVAEAVKDLNEGIEVLREKLG